MAKFNPVDLSKIDDRNGHSFMCPGCECAHYIQTNPKFSPCWLFTGGVDKPTVSPSIRVRSRHNGKNGVCHSFIKDGNIQFLLDCTHKLKGQTVELPEWD